MYPLANNLVALLYLQVCCIQDDSVPLQSAIALFANDNPYLFHSNQKWRYSPIANCKVELANSPSILLIRSGDISLGVLDSYLTIYALS